MSPVGEGELVFVHPGNHGPLTAFDAKTGAVRWSAPGRAAYASPIIVELDGVRQVVTMTENSVLGVSVSGWHAAVGARVAVSWHAERHHPHPARRDAHRQQPGHGRHRAAAGATGRRLVRRRRVGDRRGLAVPQQSGARRQHFVWTVREGERPVLRARRRHRPGALARPAPPGREHRGRQVGHVFSSS